jgi:hypothetical protein
MNDRQRLEAIISVVCKYLPPDGISIEKAMNEIISLVDPLPPQRTEQEPVKDWVASHNAICALLRQAHDALALTSYPMMHRWVGLTEDDKVLIKHDANFNQFMTAGEYADRVQQLTEARLKDKNT